MGRRFRLKPSPLGGGFLTFPTLPRVHSLVFAAWFVGVAYSRCQPVALKSKKSVCHLCDAALM